MSFPTLEKFNQELGKTKTYLYSVGESFDYWGSRKLRTFVAETDRYGSCAYDKPGEQDIDESCRVSTLLRASFPDCDVFADTVNEYARVVVREKLG